ncbi:hypothetical protein T484DRAFT_1858172 [Baffinella frigidus]|nr:hypothetical protein T484DRAFT_1858172 [Cryptophyta sp. CCMP2293]
MLADGGTLKTNAWMLADGGTVWRTGLKTNAWMLADGGTVWRTGEGLGENASGEG